MSEPGASRRTCGAWLEKKETSSAVSSVLPTAIAEEMHDGGEICPSSPEFPDAMTVAILTPRRRLTSSVSDRLNVVAGGVLRISAAEAQIDGGDPVGVAELVDALEPLDDVGVVGAEAGRADVAVGGARKSREDLDAR